MRVDAYIHTRIHARGEQIHGVLPFFFVWTHVEKTGFLQPPNNKTRQFKRKSAVFRDFFTLWGNILPYTYRGQRDGRSDCTCWLTLRFSSLSDTYDLLDTSLHTFAIWHPHRMLDCNKNFPHLYFSSKHKRGNDGAVCCAVPACFREGAGTIAQVVAECRLPSEGWRLLRIRANGIGWPRAPSCARCAWS